MFFNCGKIFVMVSHVININTVARVKYGIQDIDLLTLMIIARSLSIFDSLIWVKPRFIIKLKYVLSCKITEIAM